MPFREIGSAASTARNYFLIGIRLFIGFIFVFSVGLPLLLGFRPEALVPLGLGGWALYGAAKDLGWITPKD
ncbi:MAG: hypothetical protein AAF269_15655 [Pseudomonadota bacterium]